MLQEMGMAVGGMVTPPPQAVGNTGEYNKGGQVLYAQDGVDVSAANASTSGVNPYQAQFTQGMGTAFAPGYLSQQIIDDYQASQAPQTKIVMLYSPDGIAVSVTLPAEQAKYDQLVAEGYTTEPVATTTETAVQTGNDDPPPPEPAKAIDYTRMTKEELAKAYSQNQTAMAMMAGMAAINPIFGAFGAWATNNTKKKIIEAGYKPPEGGSIFDLSINDLVGKVKDLFGLSEEQTATVATQVGGGDDKTVTPTPTETAAILSGGGATGDDDGPTVVTGGGTTPTGGGSTGDKYVFEEDTTDYDATDDDVFDQIDAEFAAAEASSNFAAAEEAASGDPRNMNAGGFVSKRSKKNKKKK
jgi:hypothetical protein